MSHTRTGSGRPPRVWMGGGVRGGGVPPLPPAVCGHSTTSLPGTFAKAHKEVRHCQRDRFDSAGSPCTRGRPDPPNLHPSGPSAEGGRRVCATGPAPLWIRHRPHRREASRLGPRSPRAHARALCGGAADGALPGRGPSPQGPGGGCRR